MLGLPGSFIFQGWHIADAGMEPFGIVDLSNEAPNIRLGLLKGFIRF
jgi:hypothetical protein